LELVLEGKGREGGRWGGEDEEFFHQCKNDLKRHVTGGRRGGRGGGGGGESLNKEKVDV